MANMIGTIVGTYWITGVLSAGAIGHHRWRTALINRSAGYQDFTPEFVSHQDVVKRFFPSACGQRRCSSWNCLSMFIEAEAQRQLDSEMDIERAVFIPAIDLTGQV
jgi:hypothetical protein